MTAGWGMMTTMRMFRVDPVGGAPSLCPPGRSKSAAGWRFPLCTVFIVLTMVSVFCAVVRWDPAALYWSVAIAGLFGAAGVAACSREHADLSWGWLSIGWHVAALHAFVSMVKVFQFFYYTALPTSREMQMQLLAAWGTSVALAAMLTVPTLHLMLRSRTPWRSCHRWLVLSAVVALLDSALAMVALMLVLRIAWPWWS